MKSRLSTPSRMKNKKIPSSISIQVDQLPIDSQSLFYRLWLKADEAGVIPIFSDRALIPIEEAGLMIATMDKIILKNYLSSNYSPILKPDYSPHKRPLSVIETHGFSYDAETSEIKLPSDSILPIKSSLNELGTVQSLASRPDQEDKPLEGKLLAFIKSQNFALILACLLMIVQSFHSSHALADLTTLDNPIRNIFAISTAILMDCLIIYFVANGEKASSFIFFCFCALLNVYAYHLDMDYLTYKSFFAFVPALGVPFAVHAVSSRMNPILD